MTSIADGCCCYPAAVADHFAPPPSPPSRPSSPRYAAALTRTRDEDDDGDAHVDDEEV